MLKEFHSWLVITGGIWYLLTVSAFADEVPSSGIVYNTKETNSLVYYCEKNPDNSLDCEFTQMRVVKKAKAEDLKSRLNNARKEFPTSKELTPENCKMPKDIINVLQGRKKAQNKEQQDLLKDISDLEKKDSVKIMDAFLTACNSKTEESYLNTVRVLFDKDARTCFVSSNTYKQSFRLVLDDISGAHSWVAKGEPSGPCGIVQLSRFEPEKMENPKEIYWKYIAKKAVTNRQGLLMPGMACTGLDENEYIFDWRSKEHALGCDYIEFSPL